MAKLFKNGDEPPNVSPVCICRSSDSNWMSDDDRLNELNDKLSGSENRSKFIGSMQNLKIERKKNILLEWNVHLEK